MATRKQPEEGDNKAADEAADGDITLSVKGAEEKKLEVGDLKDDGSVEGEEEAANGDRLVPLAAASAWAIFFASSAFTASRLKLAPFCIGG